MTEESISTWYRKYRITHGRYAGYDVEYWRIWYPLWIPCQLITYETIEQARASARRHRYKVVDHL